MFFNSSLMPCCEQGQQELGNVWTEIAKRLPGRGGMGCKTHFNCTSSMKRLRLAAGDDSVRSDAKKNIASSSDVDSHGVVDGTDSDDGEDNEDTDEFDSLFSDHINNIGAETTIHWSSHSHIGSGEGTSGSSSSSSSSSSPRAQAQSCAAASLVSSAVRRNWTPDEVRRGE